MTDTEIAELLDSTAPLVVIEAPAGCGKTYQGANHARRMALSSLRGRILILTHTHAACSVFAKETRATGSRVEIRTIDSLIVQIAMAYHRPLGLPADPSVLARRAGGFESLAVHVSKFLRCNDIVSIALSDRYPIIIADEHQDTSLEQHEIVMCLHRAGSKLRIFGDPMQNLYSSSKAKVAADLARWDALKTKGQAAELQTPHRWENGSADLGTWVLEARQALKEGRKVDLTQRPDTLNVLFAENIAARSVGFQLGKDDRKPIDVLMDSATSMLVLSGHNETVQALRAFWRRRYPLWEGHTREPLGTLITTLSTASGNPVAVSEAVIVFMEATSVGFTRSTHGNRLTQEVVSACAKPAKGKPAMLQELARCILTEPTHVGVAKCLVRLNELVDQRVPGFDSISFDLRNELRDAMRLGEFKDPEEGFSEIRRKRSFAHPAPPAKSISTIHKAKGLECSHSMIVPCDRKNFSDTAYARCKLYVAISRAKQTTTIVVSRNNLSPLIDLG